MIGRKEVGEFQGADVSAAVTDLALKVADDALDVGLGEAGAEEFEPHSLPIKTQAHALGGQPRRLGGYRWADGFESRWNLRVERDTYVASASAVRKSLEILMRRVVER